MYLWCNIVASSREEEKMALFGIPPPKKQKKLLSDLVFLKVTAKARDDFVDSLANLSW